MRKIKNYLAAGITSLSIIFSPLTSYAYSTPHRQKNRINPNQKVEINQPAYDLPLEYNLQIPEIPKRLLEK